MANYWQKGETIDYVSETAVENGAVIVLGTRIGIAGGDIPAGGKGFVHVTGVFEFDKAAEDIAAGAACYWDAENEQITATAAGNTPAGYAVEAAASAAESVLVKINAQGAGVAANVAKAAGDAPTKAEFDALIDALVNAGLMAGE